MPNPAPYQIVIIGSGPAGLSAAGRAQQLGVSYILLEATGNLANTIFLYQKGKYVMDEPGLLPLRSTFDFTASTRETILEEWLGKLDELNINIQYNAYVEKISGEKNNFTLDIKNGTPIWAENIVLAIGMQGNIRKLGIEGEDLPFVQYQLDDPEEYEDETVVVVGAGDAAIENAIALAKQNNVIIVNRKNEFSRAKDGNLNNISKALQNGSIECYFNTTVNNVVQYQKTATNGTRGTITLDTPDGLSEIPVHRILARLGAIPPRNFLESCGIIFPTKDINAIPAIAENYQSNISGLFLIGALGGNPLIKPAMNQGYEVIEHILGNPVEPADEPLLKEKFQGLDTRLSVSEILAQLYSALPFFNSLTPLQFREFILDSEIRLPQPGEAIYQINEFTDSFYSIVTGQVEMVLDTEENIRMAVLQEGEFFGEWSLISGRRRSETTIAGDNCLLIESNRRMIKKLIASNPPIESAIDQVFIMRAVQTYLAPGIPNRILSKYLENAKILRFKQGEVIQKEGDSGDEFHLIRSGSVTISRKQSSKEVIVSYSPVGQFIGEMSILSNTPSTITATATVATETICIDAATFKQLLDEIPQVSRLVQEIIQCRLVEQVKLQNHPDQGEVLSYMMSHGLGEATDVLVIDQALCIHCDNCEKACSETHAGTSRLDREAGPTYASIHIPTSCRHCEHPHCMKDCPPDAIHRAKDGEVYIDDSCIGCGNCEQNCPYGVIQMAKVTNKQTNFWSWLMLGRGLAPGENMPITHTDTNAIKKAVKCDMCKGLPTGQACVRACPTGAAIRINPEQLVDLINK